MERYEITILPLGHLGILQRKHVGKREEWWTLRYMMRFLRCPYAWSWEWQLYIISFAKRRIWFLECSYECGEMIQGFARKHQIQVWLLKDANFISDIISCVRAAMNVTLSYIIFSNKKNIYNGFKIYSIKLVWSLLCFNIMIR